MSDLRKPLIELDPDEVAGLYETGKISEDQAVAYYIKRQAADDFYNMDPEDVATGVERGLLTTDDAERYIERKESGFIGYYGKETGRALWHGPRNAMKEFAETVQSLNNYLMSAGGAPVADPLPEDRPKEVDVLDVKKPTSGYGQLLETGAQAVSGFVGTSMALGPLGAAASAPAWAGKFPKLYKYGKQLLQGAGKGAVVDATMFDPKDKNFADFVNELGVENFAVDFMMADPNDSEFTARAKKVLEGLGMGVAFEAAFMGLKATRAALRAKHGDDLVAIKNDVDEALGNPTTVGRSEFAGPAVRATRKDVDNIMSAMAMTESGGRMFDATGKMVKAKDHGTGKWQIMPGTWNDWSMKKWGEIRDISDPKNHEELTRWRVEQLVDEGYTPQQIASIWNSGRPNWEGKVGVNKYGVPYNVPKHVERFTKFYEASIKGGPHRTYSKEVIEEVYGIEKGSRAVELADAVANAWAERTGKDAQEWWHKNLGNINLLSKPEDIRDGLFQWAGEKATGYQKAFEAGLVVKGPDGKMRFDIDDSELDWSPKLMANVVEGRPIFKGKKNIKLNWDGELGQAIEFKYLFENYPHMRDIPITIEIGPNLKRKGAYFWNDAIQYGRIHVTGDSLDDALETLVHEMQHNIQKIEGWYPGGTPDMFDMATAKQIVEINDKLMAEGAPSSELIKGYTPEQVQENLSAIRKYVLAKMKKDSESTVASLERQITENRRKLIGMLDANGKMPEGSGDAVRAIEADQRRLKEGQNRVVQAYMERTYKDPVAMYKHLWGEMEAEDAAERFSMRYGGVEPDPMDYLGTQGDKVKHGLYLRQGEKGAVQIAKDGYVILHLFETADFSTFVHELGHILRKDLDNELLERVNKWAGVGDGKWSVDHEEKFAKAFETYIANGRAPVKGLEGAFEQMKQWMLDIYKAIKNIGAPITKDLEDVFNTLLGAESKKKPLPMRANVVKNFEIAQRLTDIAHGEAPHVARDLDEGGPFNLTQFDSCEDLFDVVTTIANAYPEEMHRLTRGVVSLKESAEGAKKLEQRIARNLGTPLDELNLLHMGTKRLDEKLLAHMNILKGMATEAMRLAKHGTTDADKLRLLDLVEKVSVYQGMLKGTQTEVARGLNALRNMRKSHVDFSKLSPEQMAYAKKKGGKELDKLIKEVRKLEKPEQLNQLARSLGRNKFLEGLLEYRQGALLSGIGTHIANIGGNLTSIGLEVTNRVISNSLVGVRELLTKGETHRFGQSLRYMHALVQGFTDVMRMNKDGRTALLGMFTKDEAARKAAYEAFLDAPENGEFWKSLLSGEAQLDPYLKFQDGVAQDGALPKWALGPLFRLPFRLLIAEDEMFKAMMYRAELTFQGLEQLGQAGLSGKKADRFLRDLLDAPDAQTHRIALEKAREVTFSDPLTGGAKKLNDAVNNSSLGMVGRILFFPFVKVAVNMMKFTKDRTLVGILPGLNKRFLEDFAAGGVRRAEAVTRIATGTMLMGVGAYLGSSDIRQITGSAPKKEKDAWRNAGIQENAVRVGDKWVSYNRVEPISAFLRIGADVQRLMETYDLPETTKDELITGGAMIVANQLNSTYMRSVAEFVQLFSEPERMNVAKWLNRQAGTFAPFSAAVAQYHRGEGEELRDVSPDLALWDSFIGQYDIERLPERRHAVYGTTIRQHDRALWALNKTTADDDVTLEMAAVGANIGAPRREITVQGAVVKLDDGQYQRYQELISQVPIRETLEKVMAKPSYQQSNDPETKAAALRAVVTKAREYAKGQLLKENEDIAGELKTKIQRKMEANAGTHIEPSNLTNWLEIMGE